MDIFGGIFDLDDSGGLDAGERAIELEVIDELLNKDELDEDDD